MHISFSKDDSLYKIFKTLKKIPSYRKVAISINQDHELFNHKRWAHQLADLIKQQHLNATFIINTKEHYAYFTDAWLSTAYAQDYWIKKYRNKIVSTLFSTKTIHEQLIAKRNAPSYLIVLAELAVLWLVWSFFWWLISPDATITITPQNSIIPIVYQYWFYPIEWEQNKQSDIHWQITIPYYTQIIPYNHEMTIDVNDVTYTYSPANGIVQLQNYTEEVISLIWWTQLIVASGSITFTLDSRVNIPAWNELNPWKINVAVTAEEYTEEWEPIGIDGNIDLDEILLIRKISESFEERKIIAKPIRWFTDWNSVGKGTVLQEDIENIENKILEYMEDNKKTYLQEFARDPDQILIPFEERMLFTVNEFISTSKVWDNATFVDWNVNATLQYEYIKRQDLLDAVEIYLNQRPNESQFLINHDPFSLVFYEYRENEKDRAYYDIPIHINTIRWYDFVKDSYNISWELARKVAWQKVPKAKEILLWYDEIQDVSIKLTPPRYDTLPQEVKRIKISH